MKKILLVIIIILLLSGCTKNDNKNIKKDIKRINKQEEKETYKDLNTTPIGIYDLQGNTLKKLNQINVSPTIESEIGTFQLYPSNKESINLDTSFAESYHNEWITYKNIKLGFNIKFSLNTNEEISYNILGPQNTFDKWEYLMNYLYDDYVNRGKSFYSHIEPEEVTDETLYTAFKMQSGHLIDQINSKIEFTVFTYDSEDDFLNNEYRGNSSNKLIICLENRPC